LIYDEVESLVKTESSYKDNPDILKCVQKLQKFSVPQFMENKMKEFVRNVQGYFAQENIGATASAVPQ
jgi:ligand-binding sensor protein